MTALEEPPNISVAEYVRSLGNSLNRSRVLGAGELGGAPSSSSKLTTPDVTSRYAFDREIGRGHIGVVRLCRDLVTEKEYACKTILKSSITTEEDVNELWSEVLSMLRMQQKLPDHDGIVRLHEVYDDEESTHLIMDYCCGGDLFTHIDCRKQLSEPETAYILKQLVRALEKIHSCELIHRDLKPENILLTEPAGEKGSKYELKVADFGLCVPISRNKKARGVAGSSFYMAPEVIMEQPYGKEVDIWSLGVIVYTCLAGWLPFWGDGVEAVFHAVCTTKPDFKSHPWPGISFGVQNLICRMLEREPTKRIKVHDILYHPWMLRHCPELQAELLQVKKSLKAPKVATVEAAPIKAGSVKAKAEAKKPEIESEAEKEKPAVAVPAKETQAAPAVVDQKSGAGKVEEAVTTHSVSPDDRRYAMYEEPESSMNASHNRCGPRLFASKALRENGEKLQSDNPQTFLGIPKTSSKMRLEGDGSSKATSAAASPARKGTDDDVPLTITYSARKETEDDVPLTGTYSAPVKSRRSSQAAGGVPFLMPSLSSDSFGSGHDGPGEELVTKGEEMEMFKELTTRAAAAQPPAGTAQLPPLPARPKTSFGRRNRHQRQQMAAQEEPPFAMAGMSWVGGRPKTSGGGRAQENRGRAEGEKGRLRREEQSAQELDSGRVTLKMVDRTHSVDAAAAARNGCLGEQTEAEQTEDEGDVISMPLSYFIRSDLPPLVVVPGEQDKGQKGRGGGKAARPPKAPKSRKAKAPQDRLSLFDRMRGVQSQAPEKSASKAPQDKAGNKLKDRTPTWKQAKETKVRASELQEAAAIKTTAVQMTPEPKAPHKVTSFDKDPQSPEGPLDVSDGVWSSSGELKPEDVPGVKTGVAPAPPRQAQVPAIDRPSTGKKKRFGFGLWGVNKPPTETVMKA